MQTDSPLVLSAFRFLNSSSSEDCLYLNIWAPEQEDQFLPVIVYIHGGAFAYGGVATEELDGIVWNNCFETCNLYTLSIIRNILCDVLNSNFP